MISLSLMRKAYASGLFLMADGAEPGSGLFWYAATQRALFLPESFHVPGRLARFIRNVPLKQGWELRWNDDFRAVVQECGKERGDAALWINPELVDIYTAWHEAGEAFCLSVFKDGQRIGGIYGVQMGAVFCAESMFSRVPNASSVVLVALAAGLFKAGIEILDAQIPNDHTAQFGLVLWPEEDYIDALDMLVPKKVTLDASYFCLGTAVEFVQSLTQTS